MKTVHVKQRMVPAITDADLRWLAEQLDENGSTAELPWEFAIEKTSPSVSYSAMRREPEVRSLLVCFAAQSQELVLNLPYVHYLVSVSGSAGLNPDPCLCPCDGCPSYM